MPRVQAHQPIRRRRDAGVKNRSVVFSSLPQASSLDVSHRRCAGMKNVAAEVDDDECRRSLSPHRRAAGVKNVSQRMDTILHWCSNENASDKKRIGKVHWYLAPRNILNATNDQPVWRTEAQTKYLPFDKATLLQAALMPEFLKDRVVNTMGSPSKASLSPMVPVTGELEETIALKDEIDVKKEVLLKENAMEQETAVMATEAEPVEKAAAPSKGKAKKSKVPKMKVIRRVPSAKSTAATTEATATTSTAASALTQSTMPPANEAVKATVRTVKVKAKDAHVKMANIVPSDTSSAPASPIKAPTVPSASSTKFMSKKKERTSSPASAAPSPVSAAPSVIKPIPRRSRPNTASAIAQLNAHVYQRRCVQREIKARWVAKRAASHCFNDSTRGMSDTAVAFFYGVAPFAAFGEHSDVHKSFNITPELYPNRPATRQTVDSAIERALVDRGPLLIGCKDRIRELKRERMRARLERRQQVVSGLPSVQAKIAAKAAPPGAPVGDGVGFFVPL